MAKRSTRHVYGWKRSIPDHRDYKIEYVHTAGLPKSIDLRPKMPTPYDQGQLGSCTANGIAGVIQHQFITQHLHDWVPSRLFIYYMERVIEGTVNSDAGAEIRDGIKAVAANGVCAETEWPYVEDHFTWQPNAKCFEDAKKNIVKQYFSVDQNLPTLKSQLAAGHPVVFGITVYESFESDQVAQTGMVPMPAETEQCLGGHCVVIVGYDDDKAAFLVRNSWGTDWGIDGYFYLPYAYVTNPDLSSDFWIVTFVE